MSKKICPLCKKSIKQGQSQSVVPVYNEEGQVIAQPLYHFDCAIKIPAPKNENGEADVSTSFLSFDK